MLPATPVPSSALVLIVDDDPDLCLMLRRFLEQAGHDVIEAYSGEDALRLYETARPDLVVLDVMMPYMSGFEVAQQMRDNPMVGWTPILMLTGLDGVGNTVDGLEAGADDFLGKPYSGAELLARVRALLRLKHQYKALERATARLVEERDDLERRNLTLHRVLRRYLPQELADIILANPVQNMKLGGATYRVSVLHAALCDFPRYSSERSAQEVVATLNRAWDTLVPVIFELYGTFDKYVGDAILAFYGAPIALGDDALRAVASAIMMQERFVALQRADARFAGMGLAIGIATGEAVVGNMGSEQIIDYTVIGPVCGTAARLQAGAGQGQILICGETYREVKEAINARRVKPRGEYGSHDGSSTYQVLGRRRAYRGPSAATINAAKTGVLG